MPELFDTNDKNMLYDDQTSLDVLCFKIGKRFQHLFELVFLRSLIPRSDMFYPQSDLVLKSYWFIHVVCYSLNQSQCQH